MRQSEERYIRISDKNSNKKIFTKLFDAAAIARFSPTELREYEDSLNCNGCKDDVCKRHGH